MIELYTLDELFDIMEELEIATEEEIRLICGINGYNEETFIDILFFRTGLRTVEQFIENYGL